MSEETLRILPSPSNLIRKTFYPTEHNRGGNRVFVDGHAQYRKAKQLRARDFGLTDGSSGKAEDDNKASDTACYRSDFNVP